MKSQGQWDSWFWIFQEILKLWELVLILKYLHLSSVLLSFLSFIPKFSLWNKSGLTARSQDQTPLRVTNGLEALGWGSCTLPGKEPDSSKVFRTRHCSFLLQNDTFHPWLLVSFYRALCVHEIAPVLWPVLSPAWSGELLLPHLGSWICSPQELLAAVDFQTLVYSYNCPATTGFETDISQWPWEITANIAGNVKFCH